MAKFDHKKCTKKELFGFWFWLHLLLEVILISSPFFFSWFLIVGVVTLLFWQFWLLGNCVINKMQFENHEDSVFLYPYLKMLGWPFGYRKSKFFLRYVVPIILVLVAIIWQVVLKNSPVLF